MCSKKNDNWTIEHVAGLLEARFTTFARVVFRNSIWHDYQTFVYSQFLFPVVFAFSFIYLLYSCLIAMFKSQCKEANQKLDALLKVAYQLDFSQRKWCCSGFALRKLLIIRYKKNKLHKEILNKSGPKLDPCGYKKYFTLGTICVIYFDSLSPSC